MNNQRVFLSYSHKNKEVADKIIKDLALIGILLIRDVKDLRYRDSITNFMKKIKEFDFVLMLISDAYLKSIYCMYEVLELIKIENYRERILPIIIDTKFYNSDNILTYTEYWGNEYEQLEQKLRQHRIIYISIANTIV